jgi:hypothetical protein
MPPWLVWVIVAAVLSVAELLTLTLAAGLLAVAAGAAAVTAALGVGAAGQAVAFASWRRVDGGRAAAVPGTAGPLIRPQRVAALSAGRLVTSRSTRQGRGHRR